MLTTCILMLNEILWVHCYFLLKGFSCKLVDMSASTLGH